MSFESDLHRQSVATWLARLIGTTIGIQLLSAVIAVVLILATGGTDASIAFLPFILGAVATWRLWSSATAPMPDPENYGDDSEV